MNPVIVSDFSRKAASEVNSLWKLYQRKYNLTTKEEEELKELIESYFNAKCGNSEVVK